MAKAPIETVENLQNETSALGRINQNFQTLSDAVQRSLSREDEGAEPNQMDTTLDMNNQRIINLPPPISYTEPARHGQLQQYVDEVTDLRDEVVVLHDNVEVMEANVTALEAETEAHLEDFKARYLGVQASDPETDLNGDPLTEGAIYFNSVSRAWRVYNIRTVYVDDEPVYVNDDLVEVHQWEELPRGTLNELLDVNAGPLTHHDILRWNSGTSTWEPIDLSAVNTTFDDSAIPFTATNVQDVIEEFMARTLLNSYDIAIFIEGIPANGETVLRLTAGRPFYLPVGLVGSVGSASEVAAGTHDWLIRKNGVQVGTINWTAASALPTFTLSGDTLFAVSDVLSVHVPGTADTTLRDISVTFRAWRP